MFASQINQIAHQHIGCNGHRLFDDAAFMAFDFGNGFGLTLNRHVLVHDANATFLGNGYGQFGFGNRVHGGRHKWDVQRDVAGEWCFERDVAWQNGRMSRYQ